MYTRLRYVKACLMMQLSSAFLNNTQNVDRYKSIGI